ncbi:hypothetical protein SOVF_168470 [Spinacia oleracea]|uniref:Uncharacterized protein n=1 Tax=Spinacia oleracea TaxID=3562 RepID=A0A9R0JSR4_SPIOL|nr:uncharacterized protein LOC110785496 [Spinacia oleracea]KNA07815.1 hypothetical protein SOVF_168470 [Spinacia oleracea]
MAKNSSSKQVGGSSSSSGSSTIADLFGPNPSSSTSSSPSLFSSVFGPPSMGKGRDSTHHVGNVKHDNGAPVSKGENSKYSYYQQQKVDQPCYYTSSIYYGGQDEVYSPTTRPGESHKGEPVVEEDPKSALRGNWWQGSAYY